ncbi:hypothetical protein AB0C34_23610 [Nocardia sp. NPDC049220]|uniref:hypothetical protein n=1 Tax=Nocardia sp. NPDC049220 TaxID=3155273 RepID=UPI003406562F
MASSTSKPQLYNHFDDKLALIHTVIDVHLACEEPRPRGAKTLPGPRCWRDPWYRPTHRNAAPTGARWA